MYGNHSTHKKRKAVNHVALPCLCRGYLPLMSPVLSHKLVWESWHVPCLRNLIFKVRSHVINEL